MAEDTQNTPNTNQENAPQQTEPAQSQNNKQQPQENLEEVKVMAVLAYFGILFFLPLVTHPESKFGKFHANQGLLLLIFNIGGWLVGTILSFVLIGFLVFPIVWIATLVFFIMGIMNALNKEMKRLPLIGQFDLIK